MSQTVRIGEQVTVGIGDSEVAPHPGVEVAVHDNAPFGRHENKFTTTSTSWTAFCERTGLERLFLDKQVGLLREHPGCVAIEYVHVAIVEGAIEVWKESFPEAEPGFSEGEDADLATMIWLAYWMHWALEQCVQPVVENR